MPRKSIRRCWRRRQRNTHTHTKTNNHFLQKYNVCPWFQGNCPTEEINYNPRKKINGKNFHLNPAAAIDDDYYCRCQCQGDNVVVNGSYDGAATTAADDDERRDGSVTDRRNIDLLCNCRFVYRKNNDESSISRCILLFLGALCQQGTLHYGNFIRSMCIASHSVRSMTCVNRVGYFSVSQMNLSLASNRSFAISMCFKSHATFFFSSSQMLRDVVVVCFCSVQLPLFTAVNDWTHDNPK